MSEREIMLTTGVVPIGSYSQKDVVFLVKDISSIALERSTEERERAIQSGIHYSEMLPIEYKPSEEYIKLFHSSVHQYKERLAAIVGVVAEKILQAKGKDIVLVSLARAGTPIGILIKRYIAQTYRLNLPHYSVSIIRNRGIDENAMRYIFQHHSHSTIQFIDGWTGKGAIKKELSRAIQLLNEKYHRSVSDCLAVLADPGLCASIFGTREDFLIPSACLNSTVSGLVSRTVLNEQYIGPNDFHGAKYYRELEDEDVSNYFIDIITAQFPLVADKIKEQLTNVEACTAPSWKGQKGIERIQADYQITDSHLIKPGVGETTRVLLRRVPWKILVKDVQNKDLHHIFILAKERDVPVEIYEHMPYSCCGLIKPMKEI